MPELPEIAMYQRYFQHTALHKKVTQVEVKDERVILLPRETLKEELEGQVFESTERIGKHLFVKLSGGKYMSMHFGMTGYLKYFKDPEDAPRFTKIIFSLDDGFHLAFSCPRILGRIGITPDIETYERKKKLGQDALKISKEDFIKKLSGKKGPIKPLLMNQKTVAGLGNWIVDDMLYQAAIHPETPVASLSKKEIGLLYDKMQYIIKTAIEMEIRYDDFPDHFLITHREAGAESSLYDGKIIRLVVGGRGTYICPEGQVLR